MQSVTSIPGPLDPAQGRGTRVPVGERWCLQRFHKGGTISVNLESLRAVANKNCMYAKRRPSGPWPDLTIVVFITSMRSYTSNSKSVNHASSSPVNRPASIASWAAPATKAPSSMPNFARTRSKVYSVPRVRCSNKIVTHSLQRHLAKARLNET